ncbi:MAG: hypothetical protein ACOH1T_02790 [Microbacteriaceae bacterium]
MIDARDDALDLFPHEEEVESKPSRVWPVAVGLISLGLVVGGVASAYAVAFFGTSPDTGLCVGLLPACSTVTVERVAALAGVDLPAGTEVVEAFYGTRDGRTVLDADLLLPHALELPESFTVRFDGVPFAVTDQWAERPGEDGFWQASADDGASSYQLITKKIDAGFTLAIDIIGAP